MLPILRNLIQRVTSSRNLDEALSAIVNGVREAVSADVCSVYLLDPDSNQLILRATKGLNASAVNKVSLGIGEGLVGYTAEIHESVNVPNVADHALNRYFKNIGEERVNSFLGVPIIHAGEVLGVLVIQNHKHREFNDDEESFLITISAQLSVVLAVAGDSEVASSFSVKEKQTRAQAAFKGQSTSSGVGIGHVVVLSSGGDLRSVPNIRTDNIPQELKRFDRAIEALRTDLNKLTQRFSKKLNQEDLALFDVYIRMLDDQAIGGEIRRRIGEGQAAESATAKVFRDHVRIFSEMDDEYLRERAADVRDLGVRIVNNLDQETRPLQQYPDKCVLVARSLVATHLGLIPTNKIVGLVSVKGSSNAHVAILARAMGIPTVMGCEDLPFSELDGLEMVVDGYRGRAIINPQPELRVEYERIVEQGEQLKRNLKNLSKKSASTTDGSRLTLLANIGMVSDCYQALEVGAEGVGLYRSEVPFLMMESFPSEREQRRLYRKTLQAMNGRTVTMRTLDVGGDKPLPYLPIEEDNPFLGWRGIRVSLDHPELFLSQVRAMIGASENLNNLRIMLPMITSVSEFDRAKRLIERAYDELKTEGLSVRMPDVGVMIEVPAAVYQVDALAKRASFISVGSNDLIQYLLAVDRNNERVASVYDAFHPAVLMALRAVADAARHNQTPVSICGELAADPAAAVLLLAMGYDSLSLNAVALPKIKAIIRSISIQDSRELLALTHSMDHGSSIRPMIESALLNKGVDPLLLNGQY